MSATELFPPPARQRGSILQSLFMVILIGGCIAAAVAFYLLNPDFFSTAEKPAPPKEVREEPPPPPEEEIGEEPEAEPEPEPEPEIREDSAERLARQIETIREPVTLTNQQGTEIKALLLDLNGEQLSIRRADGLEASFSLSLLTEESRDFVLAHREAILYLKREREEAAREQARRLAASGQIRSLPQFPQATPAEFPFNPGAILTWAERDPGYIDTEIAFRDEAGKMWPTFFIGRPIGEGTVKVDFRRPEANRLGWHFHHGVQVEGEQTRRVLGDLFRGGQVPEVRVQVEQIGNLTERDSATGNPYFPVLLNIKIGPHEGRALGQMELSSVRRGPGQGMARCRLEFTFAGAAFGLSTGTSGEMVRAVIISGGRPRG